MAIQEKLYTLLISLESLDLYIIDDIARITRNYKYTAAKYCINKQTQYSTQDILEILSNISYIIFDKNLQEKIRAILIDCPDCYRGNINVASITTKQYINRFIYKYQICYKYNTIKTTHKKYDKFNEIFNTAMINIYLLHKILSYEGPYILYRYLYTRN